MTKINSALSLILLGIGIRAFAFGAAVPTPEIDPASAGSAIALLAGAVLVIRGRRK
jgi:hypothetical protein